MGQQCCKEGESVPQAEIVDLVKNETGVPASATPFLEDSTGSDEGTTVSLTVTRPSRESKWGLVWCENDAEPGTLRVKSIREGQAFATYNASVKPQLRIEPGTRLIAVNTVGQSSPDAGAPGSFAAMRSQLQSSTSVDLVVVKYRNRLTVDVARPADGTFGITLASREIPLITGITMESAVDEQNQQLRRMGNIQQVMHEGMSIVSINGEADTTKFPDLLNAETNVSLVLDRYNPAHEVL
jgi:hypothetical protein